MSATCLPFLLEAGYSTRSARDHDASPSTKAWSSERSTRNGSSLEPATIACRPSTCSSPRSPTVTASTSWTTDRDYDLIAEKTDLDFGSVWLATAGTI